MKKRLFGLLLALLCTMGLYAQDGMYDGIDFSAEVSVGAPVGDSSDFTFINLGVDFGLNFGGGGDEPDDNEDFAWGLVAGVGHWFANSDGDALGYDGDTVLPLAANVGYHINQFEIDLDAGYAFGLSKGNDGGFYYSPGVAYTLSDIIALTLAYRSVLIDGGDLSSISFGGRFKLF